MWRRNILLALRSFGRNKTSSLINAIGLSTSLACVLLIGLWVTDEYQVDRGHDQAGTVYQVMHQINRNSNDILTWEWTPGILAQTLIEEYPEVKQAVHVTELGGYGIIEKEEAYFKATEYYADANFFQLFAFPLLQGDPNTVLQQKNQVVISDELAAKLFPKQEKVVGETINWQRSWGDVSGDYVISGVFQSRGSSSTLQFDLLFSYPLYFENKPNLASWRNSDPFTFFTLQEGADPAVFSEKIQHLIQRKEPESSSTLFVRPFADRYLYSDYENGVQAGGRITYVRILSIIALLVLVIACLNFMNLSTAQASLRQKEVAMKKIAGAQKWNLIGQFYLETFLFTGISAMLALLLVYFSLPFFNSLAEKNLQLTSSAPEQWGLLVGTLGFTALLAGSYPALYLSNLPTMSLLQRPKSGNGAFSWARKGMVTLQFTLSVLLIIGMLVVYQQLDFLQNKDLGYEQDNILVFRKEGPLQENPAPLMDALSQLPGVQSVSTLDNKLTGNYGYTTSVQWEGKDPEAEPLRFGVMAAGEELIETLGINLLEGRSFAGHFQASGRQVILNQAAAKAIGYEQAVGRTIERRGETYEIVGVVEDFHFESLYEAVKPCLIERSAAGRQVVMKVAPQQTSQVVAQLEELYTQLNPAYPLDYSFLDEEYAQLYLSESRIAVLSRCFAGLAILLSCLGLFGLSTFMLERRSKEVSIRKILGASVSSITRLLSQDLVVLMLAALVIALPLGAYFARQWLADFAFRIELKGLLFFQASMLAIGLGLLTVVIQAVRAAVANPVDALRNE